jgi:hypothetical protein
MLKHEEGKKRQPEKIAAFNFTLNEMTKQSKAGVNFTNILRAPFLYKSFAQSFFVLTF